MPYLTWLRSFGVIWIRFSDPRSVWITVQQRNHCIHDQRAFISSFDALWSRQILDHDLSPPQRFKRSLYQSAVPSPVTLCLHLHYSADPPHPKKTPLSLCGGERIMILIEITPKERTRSPQSYDNREQYKFMFHHFGCLACISSCSTWLKFLHKQTTKFLASLSPESVALRDRLIQLCGWEISRHGNKQQMSEFQLISLWSFIWEGCRYIAKWFFSLGAGGPQYWHSAAIIAAGANRGNFYFTVKNC